MSGRNLVIIGGGLSGASLAYYLSRDGWHITLLESGVIGGCGATAVSRGIVRVYDPQPNIMETALAGVREWRILSYLHPGLFEQCGCMYLLDPQNLSYAKAAICSLNAKDYPMEMVFGADEIKKRSPMLKGSELPVDQWAIWEPHGGYVNTRLASQVLMSEAKRLGAVALEGVNVKSIEQSSYGIRITTEHGEIHTDFSVLAVGARFSELRESFNLFCRTIPLTVVKSKNSLSGSISCIIDEVTKSYLRPEGGNYLAAGGADQTDGRSIADCRPDWRNTFKVNHDKAKLLLNDTDISSLFGVYGMDAYTQDFSPVINGFNVRERIGTFCGFSGRGAKYIPAAAYEYSNEVSRAYDTGVLEDWII